MEGHVVEERDFQTESDDLVGGEAEVFAAGAECGEGLVAGASEFNPGGEDSGV